MATEILLVSSFLHTVGFGLARGGILFAPTEWEGRTGWRKPILFGISNAFIFCVLAKALRSQRLMPRQVAAHLAAWATLTEVGIITMQAWRGEASHFNTHTTLDATLYGFKLAGVSILGGVCLLVSAGCVLRPVRHCDPTDRAALCLGLQLLCVSVLVGFAQVAYGHLVVETMLSQRLHSPPPSAPAWRWCTSFIWSSNAPASPQASMDEAAEQLCRRATAGAYGAPCYEAYGRALLKILHFAPLHSTEILLMLSWATHRAGLAPGLGTSLVRVAACGLALVTFGAVWQTLRGSTLSLPDLARLELEPTAQCAVLTGGLAVVLPMGVVAVAPAAQRGHLGKKRWLHARNE